MIAFPNCWQLLIGPPGTGKSFQILQMILASIASGMDPARIFVGTFSRAARDELKQRLNDLGISKMKWICTLHSACYRLLELSRGQLMLDAEWIDFGASSGYDFSSVGSWTGLDVPPRYQRRTVDDELRHTYELARNCRISLSAAIDRIGAPFNVDVLGDFASRLSDYKAENGLYDFTDLLEQVLERGLTIDIARAFVDEAQDLTPLQVELVTHWFAKTPLVMAGDDDQGIYGFAGADATWLVGLQAQTNARVLGESHRVPRAAHRVASAVIARNEGSRLSKPYAPSHREGCVERILMSELVECVTKDESVLVLARNGHLLRPVAEQLMAERVPYRCAVRGIPCLLARSDLVRAVEIAAKGRHRASPKDEKLLVKLNPGFGSDALAVEEAWRRVNTSGPGAVARGLDGDQIDYLNMLLSADGSLPAPRIELMTIHASKGREADTVAILSDMARSSYRELVSGDATSEHRLAYVAVTRTRRRLLLVEPMTSYYYDYPLEVAMHHDDEVAGAIIDGEGHVMVVFDLEDGVEVLVIIRNGRLHLVEKLGSPSLGVESD